MSKLIKRLGCISAAGLLAIIFTSSCSGSELTELRISRDFESPERLLVSNATKFLIENSIGTRVTPIDLTPEESINALKNHKIDIALEVDPSVCNDFKNYPEYACADSIYANGNSRIAFREHLKNDSEEGKRIIDLLNGLNFKERDIKKAFKRQKRKSLTEDGAAAWLLHRDRTMLKKILGFDFYQENLEDILRATKTQSN